MSGIDHWNATADQNSYVDAAQAVPVGQGADARNLRLGIQNIMAILKAAETGAGIAFNTVAGIQALTTGTPSTMAWAVRVGANLYFYQYDATDTSSADNGTTILVDTAGRRWDRSTQPISITTGASGADAAEIATAFSGDATESANLLDTLIAQIDAANLTSLNADYAANTTQLEALTDLIVGVLDAANVQAIIADIDADPTSEENLATAIMGNATARQTMGRFSGGTTGAPGISFESDTNTGLYSVSADTVGFVAGGSKRGEFSTTDFSFYGARLNNVGSFGTASSPEYGFEGESGEGGYSGMFRPTTLRLGFSHASTEIFNIRAEGVFPGSDDTFDLGDGSNQWQDIFLVNSPTVSSDERGKQDISTDDDELLDKVGRIAWATFRSKRDFDKSGESAKVRFGAVAQQIVDVIGEDAADRFNLIRKDPNTGFYSLRYEELLAAYAMWSQRELSRQGETLKALVALSEALSSRILGIEAKFNETGAE